MNKTQKERFEELLTEMGVNFSTEEDDSGTSLEVDDWI